MKNGLIVQLTIILTLLSVSLTEDCSLFDQYLVDFGKEYSNDTQRQFRRQVFCEKMKELEQLRKNSPNATFGINQFSDRTQEQMKKMTGSEEDEEEKTSNSKFFNEKVGIPISVNWVEKNVVTKVKHQGGCGSCTAFATAAYFESKQIKKGRKNISFDVSEQYLLECSKVTCENGGRLKDVMEKATKGIPLQSQYPYSPFSSYSGICQQKDRVQGPRASFSASNLNDKELMQVLQDGPAAISLCTDGWDPYKGGILSCPRNCKISHAVLLVGYEPDFWIVKNSWGENWGENGYIRISRSSEYNCKIGRWVYVLWDSLMGFWTITLLGVVVLLI